MNVPRYFSSIIQLNGYICVAGGLSYGRCINSVELYDTGRDKWTKLAPMKRSRFGFTMINSNDFVYVIGYKATVERYDFWKNCWTEVSDTDK